MSGRFLALAAAVRRDRAPWDARLDDASLVALDRGADAGSLARVAWDLHPAYTALGSLLERVMKACEGHVPTGSTPHAELVEQATLALPDVRPALLSGASLRLVHELRGFRPFVRHGDAVELDADRLRELVARVGAHREAVGRDLHALVRGLDGVAGQG